MMLRRYCVEHDSLWTWEELCEFAIMYREKNGVVSGTAECRFIVVDLVRKPGWMTVT